MLTLESSYMALLAVLAGAACVPFPSAQAQTPASSRNPATPADIVDALKAVAGDPPRVRASFAKGQCVRGTYTPSEHAPRITRSRSFTQPSSILGRFAVGGGSPEVADTNKAVLRGFSFKLGPADHRSDILTQSAPVHFARSPEQMLAFLKARIPGPDGKPDQGRIEAFSNANPNTLNQAKFLATKPLPGSFAGVTYWAVHAFPATNAQGQTRFIKFKVVPANGEVTLTEDEAKAKSADFLSTDLELRIQAGTVEFEVIALLDRPGDPTFDVTTRWPDEDDRESVRLGTILITTIANNESCDEAIFNPARLAQGIGSPPDEIFAVREAAYTISLAKRRPN